MKKSAVMIMLVLVSGCAKQVYKTGTICIEPFKTVNYRTSNPVDVKQDVVDMIGTQILPELEKRILQQSKLKINECIKADFKLVGSVAKVDTVLTSVRKVGWVSNWVDTQRAFSVEVKCALINNLDQKIIDEFEKSGKRDNLEQTIDSLTDDIVGEIKYVKIK